MSDAGAGGGGGFGGGTYGGMWRVVIGARVPAEALGQVRSVGSALMYLDLIQARQLATQIQVIRETTALENATLTLNDAELRQTEIENQLTINQNMLQLSTQAHAAAQNELTQAVESGTASSFQLEQANAILSSTARESYNEMLQQISLNEQLAVSNNQVQIATNNVSSAQQILALDTQRNTDLTKAMNLATFNTYVSFGETALQSAALIIQFLAVSGKLGSLTALWNTLTGAVVANTAALGTNAAAATADAAAQAGIGASGAVAGGVGLNTIAVTGLEAAGFALLQHGGVVTRPTAAIVGEAGPEMVTPIGGGGSPGGVNINIGGMIGGSGTVLANRIAYAVNRSFDRQKRSLTK
jgi:hypothetical protein